MKTTNNNFVRDPSSGVLIRVVNDNTRSLIRQDKLEDRLKKCEMKMDNILNLLNNITEKMKDD